MQITQPGQFTLINGDCLVEMFSIPDGSVDLVLVDVPYGTTACKWDAVIPFDLMWRNIHRICKPNAAVVMTACQPFTTALINSNPSEFRYQWIWVKNRATNFLCAHIQPLRNFEDCVVFYKKQPTYHPQVTAADPYLSDRAGTHKKAQVYRPIVNRKNNNPGIRYPLQTLEMKVVQKTVHPTQKPVQLMEYFINTYTNRGETVLDFTMGSGSTGVAAMNTHREFIGIELDADYFGVACERVFIAATDQS